MGSTMTSLLEKETQLMTAWGICDYACYDVTSVPFANKLNISLVCSNIDTPVIEVGNGVVL